MSYLLHMLLICVNINFNFSQLINVPIIKTAVCTMTQWFTFEWHEITTNSQKLTTMPTWSISWPQNGRNIVAQNNTATQQQLHVTHHDNMRWTSTKELENNTDYLNAWSWRHLLQWEHSSKTGRLVLTSCLQHKSYLQYKRAYRSRPASSWKNNVL